MSNVVKQAMCAIVCASMIASGCATARTTAVYPANAGQQAAAGRLALAEYVQKLPPGTLVRVNRAQGHSVHGTLMKATDQSIFVQPKTRLPEAVVEIPVEQILAVTPESKHDHSVGRAIGAGAAAGAAAVVTILLVLIAVAND
jgi:hypothetical protein